MPARRRHGWEQLPFEELLELRLCDLGVRLEDTWLADCVDKLHQELDARGLRLKPHCWLSDEWFQPDDVPGVAVPFYLAHERLIELERRMMLEVEGGTWRHCMQLLRHETGHCMMVAYQLHRRKRWREVFGRSGQPYPSHYRPNPASRRYVLHLDGWYAQSHPDEDFAETFAVWLKPRSNWRRTYAGWPALKKLEFVDEQMRELEGVRPKLRSRETPHSLRLLRRTLRSHYEAKQRRYSVGWSGAYDRDLRRLFADSDAAGADETAASFLRRHRREIRELVSRWTGAPQFSVEQVLKEMIARCRDLRLRTHGSKRQLEKEFSVMLTAHTVHMLRRREWHPL